MTYENVIVMISPDVLFPGRTFDKFHGHWLSNREVTQGGGGGNLPPALPDSEKPSLFRVNRKFFFLTLSVRIQE